MRGSVNRRRKRGAGEQTKSLTHTYTHGYTQCNTHLSPDVHGFVPPVVDPSPATDTGVPLLVFGVGGGEVNGVAPSLQTQIPPAPNKADRKGEPSKTLTGHSPLSPWAPRQSFHPRTSRPPTPSCWRGGGSCPEVGVADL